jgi:hypothetical protein
MLNTKQNRLSNLNLLNLIHKKVNNIIKKPCTWQKYKKIVLIKFKYTCEFGSIEKKRVISHNSQ